MKFNLFHHVIIMHFQASNISHLSLALTFSHHLVLESLNIDKLICDVKALVGNPLQHCPKCVTTTTTGAVRSEECIRHAVYIEGTMILDIR